MLKEAKKWVVQLEEMLNNLSKCYNKTVDELDVEFENWYNDGGAQWDMAGGGPNAVEAFESEYRANKDDEFKPKPRTYDDIYKKMREYADRRDYTLSVEEAEIIIDQCEEEGDNIFDYSDGALREIVEDWVADHRE